MAMSKFQVILLALIAAMLVVHTAVATVILVEYWHFRELRKTLEHRFPGLEEEALQARRMAAATQLRALKGPLEVYRLDMGRYPDTLDGLRMRPSNTPKWNGPYIDREIPLDAWANPIQYRRSGDKFELWSFGPDGKNDTPDDIRLGGSVRPE